MAALELKPSRRELVASFLGLAVADVACRRPAPSRAPLPGVLVDQMHETGHLLRGPPLPRSTEPPRQLDALIVGGGAAGLSAAWRLRGAGLENFLVAELDTQLGGTAQSGKNDVSAFPWGAHYLPAPLTPAGPVPKLLREMGVMSGDGAIAEQVLVREPEERLFYRGTWYEGLYLRAGASADDLAQLDRFEKMMSAFAAAKDGTGRKAFAVPVETGSDDAEWTQLDRLSMAQWLDEQHFTSERLRWWVEYACRDDYGATAAGTSAWAAIWYFCSRQNGDTATEHSEGFLSWPEGNGRLISQLASSVGSERLQRRLLVHALEPTANGWRAHAMDVAAQKPVALDARQVVLACPQFVAARLISGRTELAARFRYSPWVVANLTLSKLPSSRGFPQAWDNVLYSSKSLGYVVATHQRPRASDVGPTVFTWYYPLTADDTKAERTRLLSNTREDWETLVRADLAPAHYGLDEAAQRLDVMRWGHAMVRPYPGFVWGGARQQAGESIGGSLHFAHTDLGGLALFEEANHFGVRAAERVLEGLGRKLESWLQQ